MPTSILVATAGAADANTYCTIAVADQYHLDRPARSPAWHERTGREAALIHATRLLDLLLEWKGAPSTYTQSLLWPRYGLYYRNGDYIPSDIIPTQLQQATAEFALQLLEDDVDVRKDIDALGLTSLQIGSGVSLNFRNPVSTKRVPDDVIHLLPVDWYVSPLAVELQRA